jgi:putative transposase
MYKALAMPVCTPENRPYRALNQNPPAGRQDPAAAATSTRVLRQDRLGGLIHEYSQVA